MPTVKDEDGYVQICLRPRSASDRQVQQEIAKCLAQIAPLQRALVERRRAQYIWEQGHIITSIILRRDALRDIERLAQKSYIVDLTVTSAFGLVVTAMLSGGARLVIELNLAATQKVMVRDPALNALLASPLLRSALDALLADGRLPEIVSLVVQTLGLSLAAPSDRPALDTQPAGDAYARQRAQLCQSVSLTEKPPARFDDLQANLNQLYEHLYVLHQRLAQGARPDQQETERYRRDFQRLAALEHVRDLKVTGDMIEVFTDTIFVYNTCLGDMRLAIDFSSVSVTIENRTHPIHANGSRYDTPHVLNGQPCLGNISQAVPALLAEGKADRLIPLLIAYVGSYNASSPYMPLQAWANGTAAPAFLSSLTSSNTDS
jgi:hypothetical protein